MLCPFKKKKAQMAFWALYQLRKLKAIRTCFMETGSHFTRLKLGSTS
jgi:hypothetical protein